MESRFEQRRPHCRVSCRALKDRPVAKHRAIRERRERRGQDDQMHGRRLPTLDQKTAALETRFMSSRPKRGTSLSGGKSDVQPDEKSRLFPLVGD